MGRKIGILGGTFNPIHNGHLALGECALKQLGLDEIWFMPSGQTNLKKGLYILPGSDRQALILLAIEGNKNFHFSDIELKRPGITYTYETLTELKKLYPEYELHFILGADCLFSIEKWVEPSIIMSHAVLVSAVRGDADKISLQKQAEYLESKFNATIKLLDFPKEDISSSDIRARIANNEPIDHLVPANVAKYIRAHYCYQRMDQ